MKKYLFLMMTLCAGFFASCEEEGGSCDSCLTPPSEEQLVQSSFADEETTGAGFTFRAANVWQATVREVTGPSAASTKAENHVDGSIANDAVWLKLLNGGKEAYTGGAGEVNLQIRMEQNYTGEDRYAAITVKSGNGSFTVHVEQKAVKADSSLNEPPVKVSEIRLDKEELTLEAGQQATLTATVLPADATLKSVKWTCRDSLVASVNPVTGRITALGAGTTVITATSTSNKEVSASCRLTVEETDQPAQPDSTAEARISRIEVANWYDNGSYIENDGKETLDFYYDEQGRPVTIVAEYDDDEVDMVGPTPGDSTRHIRRKTLRGRRRGVAASDSVVYDLNRTTVHITYAGGEVSYEIVSIEDGEELPYKEHGQATLDNNGRVTSGSTTFYEEEYDGNGNVKWVAETTGYKLSYNSLGQLTRVSSEEEGIETLTWTDGNLTACTWGDSANVVDKAYYGSLPNNLNIDVNHFALLSEAEGFLFASGDTHNIFSLLGLTGTRTKNMVKKVVDGYFENMAYEFEYVVEGGRITQIITYESRSGAGKYKKGEITIHY